MTEQAEEKTEDPVKPKPRAKKKPEFDPSKPYATVMGVNTRARYVQNGQHYDIKHRPCEL